MIESTKETLESFKAVCQNKFKRLAQALFYKSILELNVYIICEFKLVSISLDKHQILKSDFKINSQSSFVDIAA